MSATRDIRTILEPHCPMLTKTEMDQLVRDILSAMVKCDDPYHCESPYKVAEMFAIQRPKCWNSHRD